jgi:hypothetical protein
MKVWTEIKTGTDGRLYGLRYLLTDEECRHMRSIGLIGDVLEVVSMKTAADQTMAAFERDQMLTNGGAIQ